MSEGPPSFWMEVPYAQPPPGNSVLCSVLSDVMVADVNREEKFLRSFPLWAEDIFRKVSDRFNYNS